MRQDKRFNPGEVITSSAFANFVSAHFDWLMTVDPHLHRRATLSEIYTIPSTRLRAAPLLANWIKTHVAHPVLIGPDSESEQWVSEAARELDCPYRILTKTRRGDRDVEIQVPDLSGLASEIPVILDDTISSAHTMIEAVRQITEQGLKAPVCCAVHGVYDVISLAALQDAGPAQIVTTNTLECETASIDISPLVADALLDQGF
jgi:ribose-phosphate pyrophosphokinase